ncbi:rCG51119 [Rattus norvegicus]|uniref:RCG51119 n=1 Tax=Rattus norvegicus TaxID=10116 RepID=A6IZC9_RAT|nr:rCG51119 [Rattus norvegicus]
MLREAYFLFRGHADKRHFVNNTNAMRIVRLEAKLASFLH